MEKHSGEKPEGLEIVSIGSLYRGPWDKKYWSCSRGKDRYPYPVGYHALRTNAGVTYTMEVHEGVKGPLFVVTSTSGDSSSGQTPDIAWEYFQKKNGPRVKNCHGKRFSCKVDGIELFGFRNPFVQRLLRELVANIHGVAEQSLMSSNNHGGISLLEHDIQGPESHVHTDLLMYLQKQHGTRKRSRKHICAIKQAATAACMNRFQYQDLAQAVDICISKKESAPYLGMGPLKDEITHNKILSHGPINLKDATLNMNCDTPDLTGSVENAVQHESLVGKLRAVERDCNSVSFIDNVHMQPSHSDYFVGEMENKLYTMDSGKLDGSLDFDSERAKLVLKAQGRILENPNADINVKDVDLYIPDSLDITQGHAASISLGSKKGNHLSNPDEVVAYEPIAGVGTSCGFELSIQDVPKEWISGSEAHADILDTRPSVRKMEPRVNECMLDDVSAIGFVKESQSADLGRHTGSMNTHIGLAGHDLAKSMMTLLLPRAVPLLTKTYRRKRVRKHSQEMSSVSDLDTSGSDSIPGSDLACQTNREGEHFELPLRGAKWRTKKGESIGETSSFFQDAKVECTYNDITNEPVTTSGKSGIQSIIPDSFEDDQSAHDLVVPTSLCGSGEVDEAPSEHRNNDLEAARCLGNRKSDHKQADSKFEDDEGNDTSLLLAGTSLEGQSLIDNSLSACLSPDKCIISEKPNDAHLNMDESSLHTASSFPQDAIEGIPALKTYGILDNDFHPLDVEVIHRVEGGLHNMQQDVSNIRSKTVHPMEVNPNTNSISPKIDGSTTDVRHTVYARHVSLNDKKVFCSAEDPSSVTVTENVLPSIGEPHAINGMARKLPFSPHSSSKPKVPLSESIICRKSNSGKVLETYSGKSLHTIKNMQVEVDSNSINENVSFYDEKQQSLKTISNISESVDVICNIAPSESQNQETIKHASPVDNLAAAEECCDHVPCFHELMKYPPGQSQSNVLISPDENPSVKPIGTNEHSDRPYAQFYKGKLWFGSFSEGLNPTKELQGFVELIGCYLHPKPVLSVLLLSKEGALHVCTLCGHLEGGGRDLFIYKVPFKEQTNCPSSIAYTSISFPVLKDACNRTIPIERSGLQFTPDGQSLVLLNCLKTPCCRVKNLGCLCSLCQLDSCEENAIKIVHVELGYMSTVAKLKTPGRIYCILVCEPDHLLAVEESGELHVWIMNPTWRVNLEEFILPSFDYMSPSVIELKQVPSFSYLIVGHNGAGGFCLWDISKRVVLSRFFSAGNTILQALPVGLFRFPKEDASASVIRVEDHVKEILASTDFGHFQASKIDSPFPSAGESTAVWLLVSATGLEELETSSVGWRLALLAKDMVLMGSVLDPRAFSISALPGHGITGTTDGCVYIWELTTGNKLVDLNCFNGESISCIAADAKSGAFAVASDKCQLRVYIQSQMPLINEG